MITFQPPGEYLTLNKVPGSRFAARQYRATKNLWYEAAYMAAVQAFPGVGPSKRAMGPSNVYISLPVWGKRTRDPGNWTATTKPIIDGLKDAGLWPDDSPEWVAEQPVTFRVIENRERAYRSDVIVRVEER